MIRLIRISSCAWGTLGAFVEVESGDILSMTLERQAPIIPKGIYKVTIYQPTPKRKVYLINNVPGHDYVEIHWGNTLKDTKGCILVGGYDPNYQLNGSKGVSNSLLTFEKLMHTLGESFDLEVV